jgi:squalene synthase HpnC
MHRMSAMSSSAAQDHCRLLAAQHYENFPVASLLLPRRFRRPVAAIYAFARTADDMADEGNLADTDRLALLDVYSIDLDRLKRGEPVESPVFVALRETIHQYALPLAPFYDLLSAFRQDVVKKRYSDFGEVVDYCRRSANPIGRLLLCLFGEDTTENLQASDAVCTALQLINFLQDIRHDFAMGRIYVPTDEMRAFGVTEAHFAQERPDAAWCNLLAHQIARARTLMESGSALGSRLPGRFGLEIRATIAGGLLVLDKLERQNRGAKIDTRLRVWDWVRMLARAVLRSNGKTAFPLVL